MGQTDTFINAKLPSFSIILEIENLVNADVEGLSKSLASLTNQDLSPACANEVLIIDSGNASPKLLTQLCQKHPWITVHPAPLATGYYKVKMLGAQLATGEVIVYCDSDCIYESHWLRTILTTFSQGDGIQVVAGETTTQGVGLYGTAMALTYIFPQFSGEQISTPTRQYFLNNVAFRRQFLLANPIPVNLPLYRGNCAIHAHHLLQQGHTIWRQPNARATHAPPNGLSHFFWRFLLIGRDFYLQKHLIGLRNESIDEKPSTIEPASTKGSPNTIATPPTKMQIFFERIGQMVKNEPRHRFYLILSIPIAVISVILIFAGYWITAFNRDFLLETYDRSLANGEQGTGQQATGEES